MHTSGSLDEDTDDKKLKSVKVDIELKSIVNRIKGYTSQIRERVKKQKELSETFIEEDEDERDFESSVFNFDQSSNILLP